MDLRQLEYFVAVAEEANFTRAAKRVHISQSGVSAQLRQLERELGAELIDRSTRVATLTPAGAAAIGPARAALDAVGRVRQAVDDVNQLMRGQLTIAMVTACTLTPLFDALAAFHGEHPGVEVALREDTSDRMIEQVRGGLVDLALVGCAAAPPADLASRSIVSEGLIAAVRRDHALAKRRKVSLAGVVEHPLVCLPLGTGIRTVFDRACAVHGLHARVALQASAPDAVLDLASRGLGVAIVSESMIERHHDLLVGVPLTGVDSPAVLALIWKHGSNPAVRELVRHCDAAFNPPRAAAS
jgi:DNA-binding transcriptional LysR family regulator